MVQKLTFVRSEGLLGACCPTLETMYKCVFSKQRQKSFAEEMVAVVSLVVIFVSMCAPKVQGAYRYTVESCSDIIPRHVPDRPENYQVYEYEHQPPTSSWRGGSIDGSLRRKERDTYSNQQSPFRITVHSKRYRRNTDLYVQIEGNGYYDSMMLQGRAVKNGGELIQGGVGLLGTFDQNKIERRNFSYLECFRQSYATVVDNGNTRLGNTTFVWTTPEADKGDIRFLYSEITKGWGIVNHVTPLPHVCRGGVTKGAHYWIIVSSILHFNPFPITTVLCGGSEACFRVCPLDVSDNLCGSDNAILIYNYNTDLFGKQEIEFTLGGKLSSSQTSYIAVVYSEDNDYLYRADVTVCYLDNGKARVEHYLLEAVGTPLVPHGEEINIDDYDYDGTMLWCRYRRRISHLPSAVINPWRSFYTLLYRGEIDLRYHPKLVTPSRSDMFSSDRKLNLSTPINEMYSGSLPLKQFTPSCRMILMLIFIILKVNIVQCF